LGKTTERLKRKVGRIDAKMCPKKKLYDEKARKEVADKWEDLFAR